MASDPVVPDGMLGPGDAGQLVDAPPGPAVAESGPNAQRFPGGAGDSPVRGTLVERDGGVNGAGKPQPEARGLQGNTTGGASLGAAGFEPSPARSLNSRSADLLQRIDDRIRRRATDIVSAALRAPELPEAMAWVEENQDKKVPPPGWTNRQLKVAADALASKPAFYLTAAMRIVESYKKTDAPVAPVLNAQLIQVNVTNTNVYPVRKVRDE
jgi:hypothetical protein